MKSVRDSPPSSLLEINSEGLLPATPDRYTHVVGGKILCKMNAAKVRAEYTSHPSVDTASKQYSPGGNANHDTDTDALGPKLHRTGPLSPLPKEKLAVLLCLLRATYADSSSA